MTLSPLEKLAAMVGPDHAAKLWEIGGKLPEERRMVWVDGMLRLLTTTDKQLAKMLDFKHPPVGVKEFLFSKFYLGKEKEIYPAIVDEIVEINSGKYEEVVLTGGIGSGKTTVALYSQAYQLYLLSCYHNPHTVFGLDPSSEIKIIFQNLSAKLAKGVDYARFQSMIAGSPYFKEHFPYDHKVLSMLKFPNRIEIEPVAGVETGAIGQNVIGGIIDEVNFMAVVQSSTKGEDGGVYDQATALYNTIAMRRMSRFISGGRLPGLLCLVSSKKTPGQFTDKKEEEAKTNPLIYVYNKRAWDVKPPGTYTRGWFYVFIGDAQRQPRVLQPGDEVADKDRHLVDRIPLEYRQKFTDDITRALRDVAGKSTQAIHPYMPNVEAVLRNFGRRGSLFATECADFVTKPVKLVKSLTKRNPDCLRWVHIDLGLTSDSAGLVIAHVPKFVRVDRGDSVELLPQIEVDGFLEIAPPVKGSNGEINFSKIRQVLYKLRDMGMPLKWVSLDSFQSVDTKQILFQKGFTVGHVSVDTDMAPYDVTKQALYDHRVFAPSHAKVQTELTRLERDWKKGKVDHPPKAQGGSKDIADALAACVYSLSMRREIWAHHGVPLAQAHSLSALVQDKESEEAA